MPPSRIHTYHCLCLTLIVCSTHALSTLPVRQPPVLDRAIILPVRAPHAEEEDAEELAKDDKLPSHGYTALHNLRREVKATVIRREDGFERRICWRCRRCDLVVGYTIDNTEEEDASKKRGQGGRSGSMILYILPNGVMSTQRMMRMKGEKGMLGEAEVVILGRKEIGVGVWA